MNDRDSWVPQTAKRYSNLLTRQREKRKSDIKKNRNTRPPRRSLNKHQRANVLLKTNYRCHICGGKIKGDWHADHVLSYSKGGAHSEDNYLPAHNTCNSYRRALSPEEFQEIMKLGVWVRNQIIKQNEIGNAVAEKFVIYEHNRIKRRVPNK